jgi:hypothetical protein
VGNLGIHFLRAEETQECKPRGANVRLTRGQKIKKGKKIGGPLARMAQGQRERLNGDGQRGSSVEGAHRPHVV